MKKQKTVNTKGKWLIVLLLLFSISNLTLLSQTKNVGIGTTSPDGSALLDLDASDMGLLIPRVALTGTNDNTTIPDAAQSLLIYNTATAGAAPNNVVPGFYYRDGTVWVKLTTVTEAIQYLPLAGGNMSGAIDMQNNIIENIGNAGTDFTASGGLNLADAVFAPRFTSTVTNGTPPFTVASNTLVTNLNADLLDGNDASAFASSTHSHDGVYEPSITEGTASQYWRGDKTWVNFPTSFAPSGSASGDLSGSYPDPSVAKIQGSPVSATAPENNQILKWNGSAWTPASDENTEYSAGTGLSLNASEFSAYNTTALWNANQLQGKDISATAPTSGQLLQFDGTEWKPATIPSGGTVTSVGLSMPTNEFDVGTTSITESGTFNVTWKSQSANSFFSAPSNGVGIPTFRGLTAEDIPATLPASKIGSGELPVARGGTGAATLTGILKGNGTGAFSGLTATAGQVTYWSDANTIAGNDSLFWDDGNQILKIGGDLQVTGDIDPLSLSMIPLTEVPTAVEGKIYYNKTDKGLKVYNGETWVALGSGGAGDAELPEGEANQTLRYDATTNGWVGSSALINTGDKVGIGTSSPAHTLDVDGSAQISGNTRIDGELSVTGSISANGSLIYPPTTVESGENAVPTGKTYIKLNFADEFTLSNGTTAGQVIILQVVVSEGTAKLLEDSENCKISGDWEGSEYDIIQLIWDGTAWVEISRSNN